MPAATRPTSQPPTATTGGVMTRDRAWELGRYHGALEAELQETVRDCKWLKDELKNIKKNSENLRSMLYSTDRLRNRTPPMVKQAVPTPIITTVTPTKVLPVVVPDYGAKGVETSVVRYMLAADVNGTGDDMDMSHGHTHQPYTFGVPVAVQRSNSCPMCTRHGRQRSRSAPKRRLSRQESGSSTFQYRNDVVGYTSEVSTSSSVFGAQPPARSNSHRIDRKSGSYVSGTNSRRSTPPPPYRSRRRYTSGNVSDYSDVEKVLETSKRQHPRSASATPAQSSADEASTPPRSPAIVAPQPRAITVQMQQAVAGPKRPSPKEEANRRLREMIQTHQVAQTVSMPPPPYVGPTHAHTMVASQQQSSPVPNILSSTSITSAMSAPTPTVEAGRVPSTLTPHSAPLNTIFNPGVKYTPPPRAFSGSATSSFSPPTPSVRASPGTPQSFPAFGQPAAHSGPVLVPMEGSMMSMGSRRSVPTNHKDATLGSPQSVKSSASFMPSMPSYTIQIDTPNAAAAAAGLRVPSVPSQMSVGPMSAGPMPGSLSLNSNQHLNTGDLPVGESWESIDSTIPLGKGKAVARRSSDSDSEISVRSASSAEDAMPVSGSQGPRDATTFMRI